MKLKRRYLAVIVVAMLVLTAMVSSLIVNSVQGSRIAYVAVSADKEIYSVGEEVTFKLRPLTEGMDFSFKGGYYDPTRGSSGELVSVIRLPDDLDPRSVIDDPSVLRNMYEWRSSYTTAIIPVPAFSSSGGSLSMSWNGTISTYDRASNGYIWGNATAGYYLLYPDERSGGSYYYGDRTVRFFLDHSSIFYYRGLGVDYGTDIGEHDTDI